ncbi:MAG: serine hydrolase domain-containing protein [Pirellulales bacterium]
MSNSPMLHHGRRRAVVMLPAPPGKPRSAFHCVAIWASRACRPTRAGQLLLVASLGIAIGAAQTRAAADDGQIVFPGLTWERRTPAEVGLDATKLDELARLVEGRGCVVRHGYLVYGWGDEAKSRDVASAVKPVISTLLAIAVQEGKLKSVDDRLADVLPELASLDGDLKGGKNAGITWRHLASQTSGYGLTEPPGAAYGYNDFALALYFDTLMDKVYQANDDEVLRTRLAEPLEFEDSYSITKNRPGRLSTSVRDFARFGLLYLRGGRWRERVIVEPKMVSLLLTSPIAADMPRTAGNDAPMLPGQRSIGGGKNITPAGPGFYSFNWWLNRVDGQGRRLYVDAPPDTYVAAGHGGMRMLFIVPSLDLIVSWNDSPIDDHDASPGNEGTKCNQAARLMVEAARPAGESVEGRK